MQLRAPAIPLITVDPYFSVWTASDNPTDTDTVHWTGHPNTVLGTAVIDGVTYRFLGVSHGVPEIPAMRLKSADISAFTTTYVFEAAGLELTCLFTSPLLPDDTGLASRPVSYLEVIPRAADGEEHSLRVRIAVSEEICLSERGSDQVAVQMYDIDDVPTVRMGSVRQPVLETGGDDVRIDWGYFYLSADRAEVGKTEADGMTWVYADVSVTDTSLFTFAYDDVKCLRYFGRELSAYWKRNGTVIEDAIREARADYGTTVARCESFSDRMFLDATRAGGEKYAELLTLALRQVMAAHKAAVDEEGNLLFISKECFSNGSAATVDVTYPSAPLFLMYNPELLSALLRPIFRIAEDDRYWRFDFAPHDAGIYPHVDGPVGGRDETENQMPVEECGNLLLLTAAYTAATHDTSFSLSHRATLSQWAAYLAANGGDPDRQLCTDDFAGHLAHNCNLSVKAILALAAYGRLLCAWGEDGEAAEYGALARRMAEDWTRRAANGDGSYRLAFDQPDSFSMKYNLVWDRVMGLDVFPTSVAVTEFRSYLPRLNAYGLPLDSRRTFTKSDWTVWTACLTGNRADFEALVTPLWQFYHVSPDRVPMGDWYDTVMAEAIRFRNRPVLGGLWIRLLDVKGYLRSAR